jgi:hypothetical protein
MIDGHLDPLDLDALHAGEAPDEIRAHAAACPPCRSEAAALASLAARFALPPVLVPAGIKSKALRLPAWPRRLAIAASLLLAVGVLAVFRPHPLPDDANADGRVDIVDAFLLAKQDRTAEAEALARRVVSLGGSR